jgi:von Willebrand factor A domain-containing protein 8
MLIYHLLIYPFISHSVSNPDSASEIRLLSQLAPDLQEDTLKRLVAAFQDLRLGYDNGTLSYPYSLRGQEAFFSCGIYKS